jgi:hypothetical protein
MSNEIERDWVTEARLLVREGAAGSPVIRRERRVARCRGPRRVDVEWGW